MSKLVKRPPKATSLTEIQQYQLCRSQRDKTRDTFYLDYTFLSHRSSLSSMKSNLNPNHKNYLYDLNTTLDLNLDLFKQSISCINSLKTEINSVYDSIISKMKLKKELQLKIQEQKSKILIDSQIIEQNKRRLEETNEEYMERIKENEDNLDNKEEHIKIIQKKFKEIDVFLQKHTQHIKNSPLYKYSKFKMADFLEKNTHYHFKKRELIKENDELKSNINNIKKENGMIREETNINNYNNTINNNNKNIHIKKEENVKIKKYISHFNKQIQLKKMKLQLAKNHFKNLSTSLDLYKINNHNKKDINNDHNNKQDDNINNIDNNNVNDKSLLPLDITKRINNYMDFSTILNKKPDDLKFEDLDKTTGFGGATLNNINNNNISKSHAWDISCINKK